MRTDGEGPDVILKGGALKDPVKLHFTALDASWLVPLSMTRVYHFILLLRIKYPNNIAVITKSPVRANSGIMAFSRYIPARPQAIIFEAPPMLTMMA